MAPFSTSDRIRPGFNRRSREISKVTAEALESVVLVERFPRSKIRVEIEILRLRLEQDVQELLLHLLHLLTLEYQCET